jgi:hypothetical protein
MGPNPSAPLRAQALAAFSALSLPMCANLERVLRSTTLLFYFEQSEVLAALGEQTISERQMAFRARRLETESMRDAG